MKTSNLETGSRVNITAMYVPTQWSGKSLRSFHIGRVHENLAGGGVAIKFDDYPNIVDYTASEAAHMKTLSVQ